MITDIRLLSAGANTELDNGLADAHLKLLPSGSPRAYSTCATATGYSNLISGTDITAGIDFCDQTDEGRYAFLSVDTMSPDRGNDGINSITFKVTVWN